MKTTTCKIEYCDKRKFARGLCSTHYQRLKIHGSATYKAITPKYYESSRKIKVRRDCLVTDCRKPIDSLGLCQMHYTRQRNNGHYSIVKKVVGENRTKHPLYKAFYAMHDRCRNPNHKYYDYYGGRGIKVCERWSGLDGFPNFLEDMGPRPEGMTLNRKNGSKEYNKQNCEWVSYSIQTYDTCKHKNNKSGRTGVSWRNERGVWVATIRSNGKTQNLYYGPSFEEACAAREEAELKYYGFTKE